MPSHSRTVNLCGQPLHGLQHVCAFFDSREEQYEVLNPYFQEGLDSGDEVVTIVESPFHGEHVRRMAEAGVPVDMSMESGQLKVLASEDPYYVDPVVYLQKLSMRKGSESPARA